MMSNFELQLRVLRMNVLDAIQSCHYKLVVPQDKHQAAVERAEVFAGDFMAYLNEPAILGKLGLDRFQNKVVNTIFDHIQAGNMSYDKPITQRDGFPVIRLPYHNYSGMPNLDNPEEGIYAQFFVDYNVEKCLPISAYVSGIDFYSDEIISNSVYFFFSPGLITAQNITDVERKSMLRNTTVTTTPNRVLLEHMIPNRGIGWTNQYHLLGQMEWSLEPELFVYAHNSSTSRTTRYQEVPEGEFVTLK